MLHGNGESVILAELLQVSYSVCIELIGKMF